MLAWLQELARRVKSSIAPDTNDAPRDPYSYVRHPLVHRPGGRNAAVALEEPDEDQNLQLIAHRLGRRSAPREGG
jgi:GGDEF domain-containing protein